MATEAKKEPEKKDDLKKTAEETKKQRRTKTIVILSGIAVIFLIVAMSSSSPISWPSSGRGQHSVDRWDAGVLHLTTDYTPANTVELDPDDNVAQYAITANVEWELSLNGIPVKIFPVNKPVIVLADSSTIGVHTNMSARVTSGQIAQTMDIAYVKYRGQYPPRGWFKAALQRQ